jgi:uncharacterized protein
MAFSIYDASIPVYVRLLKALSANLDKAAAHAAEKRIKPEALITARLYPDMFTLAEQVRAACNHAVRGGARLTGTPLPSFEGKDDTFDALKARIDWALAFIGGLGPDQFSGAENREVVFPSGNTERRLSGRDYLLAFSMPNFMFHSATAYDILRHNGVALHKADFLGAE